MRTWLIEEENMKDAVVYCDAAALAQQFVQDLASIALNADPFIGYAASDLEYLQADSNHWIAAVKAAKILAAELGKKEVTA